MHDRSEAARAQPARCLLVHRRPGGRSLRTARQGMPWRTTQRRPLDSSREECRRCPAPSGSRARQGATSAHSSSDGYGLRAIMPAGWAFRQSLTALCHETGSQPMWRNRLRRRPSRRFASHHPEGRPDRILCVGHWRRGTSALHEHDRDVWLRGNVVPGVLDRIAAASAASRATRATAARAGSRRPAPFGAPSTPRPRTDPRRAPFVAPGACVYIFVCRTWCVLCTPNP